MSFSTIVDGVILTITRHADFSCNNTFFEDSRRLGAGEARYITIKHGGFGREELTFANIAHNWNVQLDIYSLYTGQLPTTMTNAYSDLQNVLDTLEAWPRLSDTTGVNTFEIASISPIEPFQPNTGTYHVKQQMVLVVQEVVCPTRNE